MLVNLPADQRAVLELLLQQHRSYDDIAKVLSIDRAAVRRRALAAFDALGPRAPVAREQRERITDYLLGQQPGWVANGTRLRLTRFPSERAWALVIASEITLLASGPLPEIPVDPSSDASGDAYRGRIPTVFRRGSRHPASG